MWAKKILRIKNKAEFPARIEYLEDKELENLRTEEERKKLNIRQRFKLWVCGYVYLRNEKRKGWKGYLPIYLINCEKHGYFEDYPHGYNKRFDCPECLRERR